MINLKYVVYLSEKGTIKAFSQLQFIDLLNDSVKILGCPHSLTKLRVSYDVLRSMVTSQIATKHMIINLSFSCFWHSIPVFSKIQYLAAVSEVPT